jgi:hypothetical protein
MRLGECSSRWWSVSFVVAVVAGSLIGCGGAPRESSSAPASQTFTPCPSLSDFQVFPPDNPWNTDISKYPVHPKSDVWIKSIGEDGPLHPDFGTIWNNAPSGIPYTVVGKTQPEVPITFEYADESDPGPYPIPDDAPIEGGPNGQGDRHVLVVDVDNHKLYELFHAFKVEGGWKAGSGAIFDLRSNKLRPLGWTSADAAGLPVFPGLVRYDEVMQKREISHALRFTVRRTQRGFILPATHWASRSSDPDLPPMGMRVRLKADYNISGFPKEAQAILKAFKKYGMMLADNGGDWYVSGAPDPRWNDENLNAIRRVKGSDFEVVATGPIHAG